MGLQVYVITQYLQHTCTNTQSKYNLHTPAANHNTCYQNTKIGKNVLAKKVMYKHTSFQLKVYCKIVTNELALVITFPFQKWIGISIPEHRKRAIYILLLEYGAPNIATCTIHDVQKLLAGFKES